MKKYPVLFGALSLATLLSFSFAPADKNVTTKPAVTIAVAASLKVNAVASTMKWNAKKVGGEHYGKINLADGDLQLSGNKLTGGNFTIDMRSIVVEDITRAESNKKLTDHLKSDDFFSVEKHPTSTFTITKVSRLTKAKVGEPNYTITGNLTIKGITNPITFPATVKISGKSVEAKALIEVDRTKYDIKYRSGMMGTAADKIIYDNFTIDLKLVADAGAKATQSR